MSTSNMEYAKFGYLALLFAGAIWLATSPMALKSENSPSTAIKSQSKGTTKTPSAASLAMQESAAYSDWDYIDGKKHMDALRYAEAVDSFAKAIKSNKRNSYASYQRGLALTRLKRYDEAIADLTRAISINPNNKDFYFARATARKEMKDFDAAVEDCKLAIKAVGDTMEAHQSIARIYMDKKDYTSALAAVDAAIKLNEKDSSNWYLHGLCDKELGQNEKAVQDYSQAIGLNDHFTDPLNKRGAIYLEQKDYQKALNDFDRAIRLGGGTGEVYYNRSLAYEALGRKSLADADLKKAGQLKYAPPKDK